MRKFAIVVWMLAIVGGFFILQPRESEPETHANSDTPALLTLAPAVVPIMAAVEQEPAQAEQVNEEVLDIKLCARLGVFPTRAWAERVAIILSEGAGVDTGGAAVWKVERASSSKFFLRFQAWSLDELAEKMTLQRDKLKNLVSITAIPEQC